MSTSTVLFEPLWVHAVKRHGLAHRLGLSGREWVTPLEFGPVDVPGFVTGSLHFSDPTQNPINPMPDHPILDLARQGQLFQLEAKVDAFTLAALHAVERRRGLVTEYVDILLAHTEAGRIIAERDEEQQRAAMASKALEIPPLSVTLPAKPVIRQPGEKTVLEMPERVPAPPSVDPALKRARQWSESQESPSDRGWVLYQFGDPQGWCESLPAPGKWMTGVIAYYLPGGRVPMEATGADQSRATAWDPLRNTVAA